MWSIFIKRIKHSCVHTAPKQTVIYSLLSHYRAAGMKSLRYVMCPDEAKLTYSNHFVGERKKTILGSTGFFPHKYFIFPQPGIYKILHSKSANKEFFRGPVLPKAKLHTSCHIYHNKATYTWSGSKCIYELGKNKSIILFTDRISNRILKLSIFWSNQTNVSSLTCIFSCFN